MTTQPQSAPSLPRGKRPLLPRMEAGQRALFLLLTALTGTYLMLAVSMTRFFPPWWLFVPGALLLGGALLLFSARAGGSLRLVRFGTRKKLSWRVFVAGALLCAAVMAVYHIAYWPGGLSADSQDQWGQVRSGVLDDWHPALHTMLIWLLARVVPHPAFVIAVQWVLLSAMVGHLGARLEAWGLPRWFWAGSVICLSLAPSVGNTMLFLWKDCAFALAMLWLCGQLLELLFSRGEWLRRPTRVFLLALSAALAAVLRQNGPLAALPALALLPFLYRPVWKRACATLLCACALFALIRGPLYDAAGVQRRTAENTQMDTCSLPMVILGNVMARNPDALPAEVYAYMAAAAPQEIWAKHYALGDWHEMSSRVNQEAVTSVSLFKMLDYAWQAWQSDPQLAFEALGRMWSMGLQPFARAEWVLAPFVEWGYSFGFEREGNPFLFRVLNGLTRYSAAQPFALFGWSLGLLMLLTVLLMVIRFPYAGLRSLTLALPVLCYNVGTLLLISETHLFRYFLFNVLAFPLIMASLLAEEKETL